MSSRHALVCPPADQRAIWDWLTRALNKGRGGHSDRYEITTGRYTEHFPLRDAVQADDPRLVRRVGGAPDQYAGGPLGLLDLDALREHRAAQAAEFYDAWGPSVINCIARVFDVAAPRVHGAVKRTTCFSTGPWTQATADMPPARPFAEFQGDAPISRQCAHRLPQAAPAHGRDRPPGRAAVPALALPETRIPGLTGP